MKLKEYFTEEPFDIPGVDIPCCIGDYMDPRDNDPSSIAWDEDTVEGYHYCACRRVHFLKEGEPLCDLDAVDEFAEKISTRSMDRYDAALEADRMLNEMLQKRRENDLRLGEVLTLFKKKKGEDYLGHRSIGTFAVEHLSFSGRLASELMHNHEVLSALPLTKEAYRQGEITKSALRHLSKVLTAQNEVEWLSKARNLSLRALEIVVREVLEEKGSVEEGGGEGGKAEKGNNPVGGNPETGSDSETGSSSQSSRNDDDFTHCAPAIPSEESAGTDSFFFGKRSLSPLNAAIPSEESDEKCQGVMMYFNVSCRLAPAWDFALEHFRNKEQYNGPISGFVEALLAGYISSGKGSGVASPAPLDSGQLPVFYRCYMREDERDEDLLIDDPCIPAGKPQHSAEEEDEEEEDPIPRRIIFPPSFYENPETVEALAAKLIELGRNRQELDVAIGKILRVINDWGLYRVLDYRQIEEYGKKRCDFPNPLLYRLMRLADGFRRRPLIEKAFKIGLLSREQARLILKISSEENERIWIDYAAHAPSVTLKEELERCARIIEYDFFAPTSYNILPGFRYITDDMYHGLSEEMKEILRTGSWYQRSSPEQSWPLEGVDEHMLMERDPRLEEPWKHFEDVDDYLAYEREAAERRKKSALCAGGQAQRRSGRESENSLCADGQAQTHSAFSAEKQSELMSSGNATASCLCLHETDHGADSQIVKVPLCASSDASGKALSSPGTDCSCSNACSNNVAPCDEKTLSKAREICMMPHGADPAETFLMDILADDSGSRLNSTHRLKWGQTPFSSREESIPEKKESVPGMSIRFFLPEELYDLWNTTFAAYLQQSVAEGTMLRRVNDVEDIYRSPLDYADSAEGFLAALLQEWLLTEKLHLKVTRDYAILKRDRFRCQVPGCNCRRNLHIHHIIWRSKGGTDDPANLIVLCAGCHLRLLHNLLTLKIEGTAPHNLTFTFGPRSHGDERPFLKYVRGRKVLTEKNNIMLSQ
ncbi:MAG: HNH endonuclease [Vulcanimicrobiota bacterium]